jgi:hypothetical protein
MHGTKNETRFIIIINYFSRTAEPLGVPDMKWLGLHPTDLLEKRDKDSMKILSEV